MVIPLFSLSSEDNLMNCFYRVRQSRAPQEAVEWVYSRQETLNKLTWSTRDPLVVSDSGSALVKLSSIFLSFYSATLKDL